MSARDRPVLLPRRAPRSNGAGAIRRHDRRRRGKAVRSRISTDVGGKIALDVGVAAAPRSAPVAALLDDGEETQSPVGRCGDDPPRQAGFAGGNDYVRRCRHGRVNVLGAHQPACDVTTDAERGGREQDSQCGGDAERQSNAARRRGRRERCARFQDEMLPSAQQLTARQVTLRREGRRDQRASRPAPPGVSTSARTARPPPPSASSALTPARSRARARASRDRTVPIGICSAAAVSS